ncbi:MAG: hypothetical protein M1814_000600 [Vezdaea aestivalis]|nr:MAG: hypothetical protein M1814_000600 [Vezdaea aestivalis]
MAPPPFTLSDTDLATLLSQDASERASQYKNIGLQAFLPQRNQPSTAPKPNKRFLRSILHDTTAHNAALKRKEGRDAGVRLRELDGGPDDEDRHRDRKRRRRRRRSRDRDRSRSRSPKPSAAREDSSSPRRRKEGRRGERYENEGRRSRRSEHEPYDRRRRRGSDSASDSEDRERSARRHHHRHSRHSRRHRSISPPSSRGKHSKSGRRERSASPRPRAKRRQATPSPSESSDPLEELIGPRPERRKGRGRFSGPAVLGREEGEEEGSRGEGDEDDWGVALRAVRAKEIYRGSGSRERADEAVEVKWRGKGEGREWDAGKVV